MTRQVAISRRMNSEEILTALTRLRNNSTKVFASKEHFAYKHNIRGKTSYYQESLLFYVTWLGSVITEKSYYHELFVGRLDYTP